MVKDTSPPIVNPYRFRSFGTERADYWRDGVFAKEDFRYWAVYHYLRLSPSFIAVLWNLRGRTSPFPLPADAGAVERVVKDFRQVFGMLPSKWWRKYGKHLYGVPAPAPKLLVAGRLSATRKSLNVMWDKNDAVVLRLAVNQTKSEALKEIEREIDRLVIAREFGLHDTSANVPKYAFLQSRIRQSTLALGAQALTYYTSRTALPLWWIGNLLDVSPSMSMRQQDLELLDDDEVAYRKKVLAIATSRIVNNALLIAENAARGRFPSAQPFPEAMLTAFQRSAGRPPSHN